MLALTGPAEWDRWVASVDAIAELHPRTVVAGHRKPEDSDHDGQAILANTRNYIRDFARIAAEVASADELVKAMQERYPDHGNLTTLIVSAQVAKGGASIGDQSSGESPEATLTFAIQRAAAQRLLRAQSDDQ